MYNGIINIYKEKGYTSHDVVAKMRGILKQKKIGHTGTLDPDAEGVLPVCLGTGTKLSDMLTDKTKTYRTVLLLGRETDTQDTSGQTIQECEVTVQEAEIVQTIMQFIGSYMQIPPMYSALKVNGKKLYELAREGKVVERTPRPVDILNIEIISVVSPRVTMEITCSKGTYIRTICHDIGKKLGCGGCMESLLRTRVEQFHIEDSLCLQQIRELKDLDQIQEYIISVEQMFEQYPKVSTQESADYLIYNGNIVKMEQIKRKDSIEAFSLVRLCDSKGQFIGIYEYIVDEALFKPRKMFLGG